MNPDVSAKPYYPKQDLGAVEKLATLKSKSKLNIQVVQALLGGLEYFVYLLAFAFLFVYKVVPAYPQASGWKFWQWPGQIAVFQDYVLFLLFFLGMFFISMYQKQFYNPSQERNLSDEIFIIARTVAICFLVTIGLTFAIKNTMVYSRILLFVYIGATFLNASAFRYLRKWTFYQLKKQGKLKQNILVVGAGRIGRQLRESFQKTDTHGYQFVGYLDDEAKGDEIVGSVDELEKIVHEQGVDILYITIPSEKNKINLLLQKVYKYHLDIRIIPELYDRMISIYEYREDNGYPCLQIVKTPLRGFNLIVKRFMDVVLSAFGLLLISPLLAVIATMIKVTSPGPILFKQKRLGTNGVPFLMYKFRSMVNDAESLKHKLSNDMDGNGPLFKAKNDPRVTKVGAFLRKYSLDELPQLLNVIKGEMSLIGPRPPLPSEVEQYSDFQWRRMDVRPGMTGLWQVSGRSDLTFEEWIALDIQYIERWSLALELTILLKTFPVVLKGKGAY